MKYPCIMCGLCCCFLKGISELEHLDSGNGDCVHLKNNRCEIYSSRPMLCNTEQMWDSVLSDDMSEDEFIYANLCGCLNLNMQFGSVDNVEKLKAIMETYEKRLETTSKNPISMYFQDETSQCAKGRKTHTCATVWAFCPDKAVRDF